ncbi:DMT family transporter [Protaetiibacter larvae]|uniref:EamA family transporter n=1 Tax=Protaetiibacter larvae TaxID=2592654 RepID=A0A5C1YBD4_9MICO|nr:EamA family transporter [Protaetiibacter larvae]QEO10585.1 EamA family transporter [Protaetiibacter larvae]
MPTTRLSPAVLAAIGFTVLAWASAFIVIRGVAPEIGGGALALGRLTAGSVAIGALLLVTRRWLRPSGREWALLVLYGVAWFGAYNVTLNLAEHTLDAGTTAMIVNIGPILIALGAGLFLGEGIPRWLAIGAGVAFTGVLLIGLATSVFGSGGRIDVAGVIWAVASAVTYAVGVLAQKPLVRRLPPVQVTFLGCVIGMVACLPFAGQLVAEASVASSAALWGVVYLGVVPTALAFTSWGYALARVPAGQLGISTYLVPPLAILAGWLVFREVPGVLAVIGGVLCLTGVALSRRRPRERVPASSRISAGTPR